MSGFSDRAWQLIKLLIEGGFQGAEKLVRDNPGLLVERNAPGETPLHWLVVEDHLNGARWLLERGECVESPDYGESTLLIHAAMLNYVEMSRMLLQFRPNVNARNRVGRAALDAAAMNDQTGELTDLLLRAGADVHSRDQFGNTALRTAAESCNTIAAARLLAAGADPNARNNLSEAPVHGLAQATYRDTEPQREESVRMLSEFLAALTRASGDRDAVDADGRTVLHHAAILGNVNAVRCLLRVGFDRIARDESGLTPLAVARDFGKDDVAALLS